MTVIAERPAATETTTEELLASMLGRTQPAVLVALGRVQTQRADCDREWQRLDNGDPSGVLRQPVLAKQMLTLAEEEKCLLAEYADAGQRAEALIHLAAACERARQNVDVLGASLRDHPPADPKVRQRQLHALDDAGRLLDRICWTGQRHSTHRLFREPADPLRTLRLELELRLKEVERTRVPGAKGKFAMPANLAAIIDVLDGRAPKEERHAALS